MKFILILHFYLLLTLVSRLSHQAARFRRPESTVENYLLFSHFLAQRAGPFQIRPLVFSPILTDM